MKRRHIHYSAVSGIVVLIFIYVLIPLVYHSSPALQRELIFHNDVSLPDGLDLNHPENADLFGAINRNVSTNPGIYLGLWQILPRSLISSASKLEEAFRYSREKWFESQLVDGRPIVVYCHGNQPSRATEHRIMLYKVLQKMDYHIIAFDYRGFADSSKVEPSEDGLVSDVIEVIRWVKQRSSNSPLFVWGHSLGTSVATKAVANFCSLGMCPDGLVLQAPFTSLEDELMNIRITMPYRVLPWFRQIFIEPLTEQHLIFNTKETIKMVTCPIMILHAEDDIIVPFMLGEKLYKRALATRPVGSGVIQFVAFDKKFGYGHNFICKAPNLPDIVRKFFKISV